MGCCCSKQETQCPPQPPFLLPHEKHNGNGNGNGNASRWDPPEEETVKEVLSETPPAPKAKPSPPPSAAPSSPVLKPEISAPAPAPAPAPSPAPCPSDGRSEHPQPSDDACSFSEASNATSAATTATSTREREAKRHRDREETTTASRRERSYSGELVRGGASRSRRERSSPAVVSAVGCRSGRTSPVRNPSFGGSGNGLKRDAGERSGRRSLSPGARAKRREVAAPGGTGEKLPVRRVPPRLPMPDKAAAAPLMSDGDGGNGWNGNGNGNGKECLENPSVSLECFIFL